VSTASGDEVVGEDFAVLRLRRRVLTQSYVGAIYTWRHAREALESDSELPATADADRHTLGADFRYATSTFLGSENLEVSGYLLGNSGDEQGVSNTLAFGSRVSYPNDLWSGSFDVNEVRDGHAPAVGFVRRRAFRSYSPSLTFAPRPANHPVIRQLRFGGDLTIFTDLDNRVVTREWNLTLGRIDTHAGDNVQLSLLPTYERLEDDFRIATGVVLPAETTYGFTRWRASMGTANRRILAVNTSYTWGSFFSGDRQEATLGLGIRPRPGITVNLSTERNRVELPEGTFNTSLYRFIADTQLNPRIYLVNNLQFDSVSDVLGWQVRFRWIVRPGNDLYLVYMHNWQDELSGASGFRTMDRRAATKISYTHRF
jgi:hypothetical protein